MTRALATLGLVLVATSSVLALGCGGTVFSPTDGSGDGGAGDSGKPPPADAQVKDTGHSPDTSTSDGGCIANPTLGGACTPGEQACQVGNPCCIGYVWECSTSTSTWIQLGVGCSCQVQPDASTEVPTNHRPDDSQCAGVPAAGTCSIDIMMAACSQDSQCTAGTNGRCIESMGGALYCSCSYDTCQVDTNCPAGQLCACHGSPYLGGNGNTCEPGNCRVDSDCGPQGYCSPSGGGGCGGLGGYYCHTSKDTCVNDSDCASQGPDICAWSAGDGRWECQQEELCG